MTVEEEEKDGWMSGGSRERNRGVWEEEGMATACWSTAAVETCGVG